MGKKQEVRSLEVTGKEIWDRKYIYSMFRELSVNLGEPYYCCIPESYALQMFGVKALNFIYEAGHGLCTSYGFYHRPTNETYITTRGFDLMWAYRAAEMYRKKHGKMLESEVEHDTVTRKQHRTECINH